MVSQVAKYYTEAGSPAAAPFWDIAVETAIEEGRYADALEMLPSGASSDVQMQLSLRSARELATDLKQSRDPFRIARRLQLHYVQELRREHI